jgi:hypothetical protein
MISLFATSLKQLNAWIIIIIQKTVLCLSDYLLTWSQFRSVPGSKNSGFMEDLSIYMYQLSSSTDIPELVLFFSEIVRSSVILLLPLVLIVILLMEGCCHVFEHLAIAKMNT